MANILRDPIWTFIWPSVAAVLMVVSILLAWRQRRAPGLSFRALTFEPIISRTDQIEGKIQLLFQRTTIKNAHMIIIRITNSGNTPIKADDYEEPITVSYGESARVLSAETLGTGPRNVKVDPQIQGNRVELSKVLMNRGECITLKALVSEASAVSVSAHIVGVRKIRQVRAMSGVADSVLIGVSLLVGVFFVIMGVMAVILRAHLVVVAVFGVGGASLVASGARLWFRLRG